MLFFLFFFNKRWIIIRTLNLHGVLFLENCCSIQILIQMVPKWAKIDIFRYFWKPFITLDPRLVGRKGPMNSGMSVRTSVRPSVHNTVFSELAHCFFLIFCMKLGIHKGWKVTEPNFSGKYHLPKNGQKGPKMAQKKFFLRILIEI